MTHCKNHLDREATGKSPSGRDLCVECMAVQIAIETNLDSVMVLLQEAGYPLYYFDPSRFSTMSPVVAGDRGAWFATWLMSRLGSHCGDGLEVFFRAATEKVAERNTVRRAKIEVERRVTQPTSTDRIKELFER